MAGTDEVGRGCLAGPVVAAAVVLKPGGRIGGLRDSKLLTPRARRRLVRPILDASLAWGIAAISPMGIDRLNIRQASLLAMRRALRRCALPIEHVLVDGFPIPDLATPQTPLVGGDRRCRSIAAASVLAKVARDRRMDRLDAVYPGYGFRAHRGYPTPEHLAALERLGITPIHRRSFAPVRRFLEGPLRLPL